MATLEGMQQAVATHIGERRHDEVSLDEVKRILI